MNVQYYNGDKEVSKEEFDKERQRLLEESFEKLKDIKSDEYAVIIGHETFVHHSEKLDKIRAKSKKGDYKSVNALLTDIIDLAGGADKEHVKLSKDQIKLFINMINELNKKENTNKYKKMYEENKDSNQSR